MFQAQASSRPFSWQSGWVCATYIGEGIRAQTDVDLLKPFRGRFTTERGAALALRRIGDGDLAATVAARLPEYSSVDQAQIGDVVLFDQPNGLTCGFVMAGGISALTEDMGLWSFGLDLAQRTFRVGAI